jgi:hypothetical protein
MPAEGQVRHNIATMLQYQSFLSENQFSHDGGTSSRHAAMSFTFIH